MGGLERSDPEGGAIAEWRNGNLSYAVLYFDQRISQVDSEEAHVKKVAPSARIAGVQAGGEWIEWVSSPQLRVFALSGCRPKAKGEKRTLDGQSVTTSCYHRRTWLGSVWERLAGANILRGILGGLRIYWVSSANRQNQCLQSSLTEALQ